MASRQQQGDRHAGGRSGPRAPEPGRGLSPDPAKWDFGEMTEMVISDDESKQARGACFFAQAAGLLRRQPEGEDLACFTSYVERIFSRHWGRPSERRMALNAIMEGGMLEVGSPPRLGKWATMAEVAAYVRLAQEADARLTAGIALILHWGDQVEHPVFDYMGIAEGGLLVDGGYATMKLDEWSLVAGCAQHKATALAQQMLVDAAADLAQNWGEYEPIRLAMYV